MEKVRILLVDDDDLVRRAAERLLSGVGDVTAASGGLAALEIVRRFDFDLVVSDIDMPVVDGPSLMSTIMKEGLLPPAAFVFMSGSHESKLASLLRGRGVLVVQKDHVHEDLVWAVRASLASPALTERRRVARMSL